MMVKTLAEAVLHAQVVLVTIVCCLGVFGLGWLLYQMLSENKEHDD